MTITKGYKREEFERLLTINDACYTGVERPTLFEFENMLKHTDVFVARTDNGMVIGFAICKPTSTPYIWSIAVDPRFQGRGVGGNLLREIIRAYTLTKEPRIGLHVHPDNPAQKLYFDYGFRVRSIIPKWYETSSGLYMEKEL